jgi:hypothetical protein
MKNPEHEIEVLQAAIRKRAALIDAFVRCDEFIESCQAHPNLSRDVDPQLPERLAIRLLVKRYGWLHVSPSVLQRAGQ